ncbi:MAG: 30S ribosomal protein S10 [DPANN group archaeon]|nr:30S ribosomal protein S10 [DPANN group archaeon]
MQVARIKLSSVDHLKLDTLVEGIKVMAQKQGATVSGPMPLPTKKLKVTTRKSPCGDGTETYEKWEMRIHKRVLDLSVNERALRNIMRIQIPDGVHIEIDLKD